MSEFACGGGDIYLMYGQTEASGRISVLPPELFYCDHSSVGFPVKRGEVEIGADQRVIYRGPNVMLGYTTNRESLALGDSQRGALDTGDLGRLDSRGLLYITGRSSRCCKVFGTRVCLDDIEDYFSVLGPVAAVAQGDTVKIYFEGPEEPIRAQLWRLALTHRLPPQGFLLRRIAALPRTANGKIEYPALQ
jgi:long-subunit acyl-CoA synthetase (AMP-forming)